jgi:hypothetical protein
MFISLLIHSQHVSGIIMPIIRRTTTKLFKTACGDVCNTEKNMGCIVVADFLSCDHVRICACMWVQRVVIVGIMTFP